MGWRERLAGWYKTPQAVKDILNTGSSTDFSPLSHPITFEPRSSRKCVDISIADDEIVEKAEYFTAVLSRDATLDSRVQLGKLTTMITIIDNDGKYLMTSYTSKSSPCSFLQWHS